MKVVNLYFKLAIQGIQRRWRKLVKLAAQKRKILCYNFLQADEYLVI